MLKPATLHRRRVLDRLPSALELHLRRWSPRQRRDPLAKLLKMSSLPGTLAIDVGAHRGRYTVAMLAGGARVLAIEANPELSARLSAAIPAHRGRVVHGAASRGAGRAVLRFPVDGRLGEATTLPGEGPSITVPAISADDLVAHEDVSVIKIDVEGAEFDVIQGAREVIGRCRPVILMEIERRHTGQELVDSFERMADEFGYRPCLAISLSGVMAIGRFSPEVHQYSRSPSNDNYVNNFLFVEISALPRQPPFLTASG